MTPRVFIDGNVGTVGLRIRQWLAGRRDLELVELPESQRKDLGARRDAIQSAQVAVLCLPDPAAREAAEIALENGVRVLDASTAHRVAQGWVFGLPELGASQRAEIARARAVATTGCWSVATILLVKPLVDAGILSADTPLHIHGLSGYTGGGREMIAKWEDPQRGLLTHVYEAPYALDKLHKHVPEMKRYGGLTRDPAFVPAVGPFACGMRVEIPLHADLVPGIAGGKSIYEALETRYKSEPFVKLEPMREPLDSNESSFDPRACNDTNRIELRVLPHPSGHVLLMAILDNLGKGASGSAIQNLNLMLGLPEGAGLTP
jgi:N-acetyl-gamma-glutamyl-phosphate reductase